MLTMIGALIGNLRLCICKKKMQGGNSMHLSSWEQWSRSALSRTSLQTSTACLVRSSSGPVAQPCAAPLLVEATGIGSCLWQIPQFLSMLMPRSVTPLFFTFTECINMSRAQKLLHSDHVSGGAVGHVWPVSNKSRDGLSIRSAGAVVSSGTIALWLQSPSLWRGVARSFLLISAFCLIALFNQIDMLLSCFRSCKHLFPFSGKCRGTLYTSVSTLCCHQHRLRNESSVRPWNSRLVWRTMILRRTSVSLALSSMSAQARLA